MRGATAPRAFLRGASDRGSLLRQPVDLAAGKEEGPYAAAFRGVGGGGGGRVGADGLHVGAFAAGDDTADEGGPGFAQGGSVGRAIEEVGVNAPSEGLGVDAPREGLGAEAGAAGFLQREARGLEQAGAPEPVGLLAGEDLCGDFSKVGFEASAEG